MVTRKRYRAFISYSRRDARQAKRLHRALETYRVPRDIVSPALAPGRRLGKFFLDDEESAADPDLDAVLRAAIEESDNLIVVCSLASAKSDWVDKEVRVFLGLGKERVLSVIVDGEPRATDAGNECYCPTLRRINPLGIDWRRQQFARVMTKVVAGILRVDFDDLWKRHKRRRTKQRALATIVLLALGVFGFAIQQIASERDFASQLASEAQELLERREFRLEGKYGTNEALVGVRQVRRALPVALAALPHSSDLLPYDGPMTDCGSFGRIPECRCVGLRVAFAMPEMLRELPGVELKYSAGAQLVTEGVTPKYLVMHKRVFVFRNGVDEVVIPSLNLQSVGALAADRDILVLADSSGSIRLFDLAKEQSVFERIDLFSHGFADAAFSPEGSRLALASNRGEIALLVRETDQKRRWTIAYHDPRAASQGGSAAVAFAPDGEFFVVGHPSKELSIHAPDGQEESRVELPIEGIRCVEVNSTSRYVAVGGRSSVALVDRRNPANPVSLPYQHSQSITALDFSPDDRLLLSAAHDNNVVVWNLQTQEIETVFSHGWHVQDACFLDGGQRIASTTHHGDVWVWDLRTRSELMRINGTEQAWPVLGPNGLFLAQPDGDVPTLYRFRDLSHLSSSELREELANDLEPDTDFAQLGAAYGFTGRPTDPRKWRGLKSGAGWRQAAQRLFGSSDSKSAVQPK